MPRFYFHVFNDETCLDQEGLELADAGAARRVAVKEARVLMAEAVKKGEVVLSHHIAVEDEDGASVCNVTFGEAVRISM